MPIRHRTVLRSSRGFTLVELLAVVVITAVLSLLAVAGFRRHMQASRGTEAVAVIGAIRAAQESYLAENHIYLNVSLDSWYPGLAATGNRTVFSDQSHTDYKRWRQLAPAVNQNVMFRYLVNAGVPGTVMTQPQGMTGVPALTAPQPLDWYMIQARGDVNENSKFSRYAANSITGEVYVENEGE